MTQTIDVPWLVGGGDTGKTIRDIKWDMNPLGQPSGWAEGLKTLVGVMLSSKQPMFVAWGDERRMLYNDGYAEMLQSRHPSAMGERLDVVWSDIMDDVGPMIEDCFRGKPTYMEDIVLYMTRQGVATETHFAFSYNPIIANDGSVSGVFCTTIETTERVKAERDRAHAEELRAQATESIELALDSGAILGTFVWNIKTNKISGDSRFAATFSADEADTAKGVTLETIVDSIHPDDRDRVIAEISAAVDAISPYRCVYRALHKSGTYQWIMASGVVIPDEHGNPERFPGVLVDMAAQHKVEEELRATIEEKTLLTHELDHRVKNILTMVTAVAYQTFRGALSVKDAAATFSERLRALGSAQDILTRTSWQAANIENVIVASIPVVDKSRVDARGPDVELPAKSALTLALAIHELSTNAIKYGALSVENGRVQVRWAIDPKSSTLKFTWAESGGPRVSPPKSTGFGSRLVGKSLPAEFGGKAEFNYLENGLRFDLIAPFPLKGAANG